MRAQARQSLLGCHQVLEPMHRLALSLEEAYLALRIWIHMIDMV